MRTRELDEQYGSPQEKLELVDGDGRVLGEIYANVHGDIIYAAYSENAHPEPGYELRRRLPFRTEEYLIIDPGFRQGTSLGHSRYIMRVRNKAIMPEWTPSAGGTHITQTGPNARVNIQSEDSSTNIALSTPEQVFDETRRLIRVGIADAARQEQLLPVVQEMQETRGTPGYNDAYWRFMGFIADHIQVFQAVLPTLSGWLGGGS